MKIATFRQPDGHEAVGLVTDDGIFNMSAALQYYQMIEQGGGMRRFNTVMDFLHAGLFSVSDFACLLEFADSHNLTERLMVRKDYSLLAPIKRPQAIYALGRNFPAHALESGAEVPKEPIVFGKAVTSVIGPEEPVIYKKWLTRVDPEAELAVVIAKRGSEIPESEAEGFVAGYTCLNDVTARDIQTEDLAKAHPWLRSKGLDTFCPMGPWIVLPDEITMPVELDIEMRVNGEVRQKDNTASQTFKVPFLIHWISRYHTLYPGDVITTGTPEGMKPVTPGDVMEVYIEKIGVLRNPVVEG